MKKKTKIKKRKIKRKRTKKRKENKDKKKQKTAKELWEYDKNKIDLIKEKGYNLEIVWESDLKEDHKLINKLIKKYDAK